MAGDKFNIKVSSWYRKNGANPGSPNSILTDLVANLIGGLTGINSPAHGSVTATQLTNSGVMPTTAGSFLNNQPAPGIIKPKAYLNWVLLDEQFKFVQSGSGAEQVGDDNALTIHTKTNLPITRSGYLYVFVSNETPNIDVFFDNLQVTHIRSPILEETHYYPFGLTMAGISSKAALGLENRYKYNGIEFDQDLGLDSYEAFFRNLDPQTGRWWQVDPETENMEMWSPYASNYDNPILYQDPLGNEGECCGWLKDIATTVVATVSVGVDNVLGTNATGTIANSGAVPSDQVGNWNRAVTSANNASLVAGVGATVIGGDVATGSAAATLASGGTASVVTAPAFLVGAGTAVVGSIVTANASKNLASGNGLIKGTESNPEPSSKAARRDAMRQEGVPTSQQPVKQKQTPAGRVLEYDVPKPGGGTAKKQAQQQTKDRNHGPHWEVGTPKKGGQKDPAGRDRLQNDKSKSFYK